MDNIDVSENENQSSIAFKIIKFCKIPRSRDEIAKEFGFSAMSYMMSKYVQPLIDQGKLNMTVPEKPKSKKQRYSAAEQGSR